MKKLWIFIIFLGLLSLFLGIYHQKFINSYKSYQVECLREPINGCVVGSYDAQTDEISIYVPQDTEEFKIALKHELVHSYQMNRTNIFRAYNCDNQVGYLMNEIEAYFREDYWK